MKIKFSSDDTLPLNKMLKLHMSTVIIKSVFEEDGRYYTHVFLAECLHEVYMLENDRINISEGININKTNVSKECDIFHYWYFLERFFKYEPYFSNGCRDLMQKAINFNGAAIFLLKEVIIEFIFYI